MGRIPEPSFLRLKEEKEPREERTERKNLEKKELEMLITYPANAEVSRKTMIIPVIVTVFLAIRAKAAGQNGPNGRWTFNSHKVTKTWSKIHEGLKGGADLDVFSPRFVENLKPGEDKFTKKFERVVMPRLDKALIPMFNPLRLQDAGRGPGLQQKGSKARQLACYLHLCIGDLVKLAEMSSLQKLVSKDSGFQDHLALTGCYFTIQNYPTKDDPKHLLMLARYECGQVLNSKRKRELRYHRGTQVFVRVNLNDLRKRDNEDFDIRMDWRYAYPDSPCGYGGFRYPLKEQERWLKSVMDQHNPRNRRRVPSKLKERKKPREPKQQHQVQKKGLGKFLSFFGLR